MPWPTRFRDWVLPQPESEATSHHLAGLHHFQRRIDGGYMRYHLRIEPDGHGVLIAGASEAVMLSPDGVQVVIGLLNDRTKDRLASELHRPDGRAIVDQVAGILAELGHPSSRFPIFNLVDPEVVGQRLQLVSPLQADVVVGPGANQREILDRLWNVHVPHVRLNWPRSFPHSFVVHAVTHAEDLGMIAGVRATATQLSRPGVIIELAEAGLDYVLVPWGVTRDFHAQMFGMEDWDKFNAVIAEIRRWEMTPVIDAPLHPAVLDGFEQAVEVLDGTNVHHVEVFALVAPPGDPAAPGSAATGGAFEGRELRQLASYVEDVADNRRMQMIWLPPIIHKPPRTLAETAALGPRAAGDVSIRVEMDGRVVPPRGPYRTAGNIMTDMWHRIWGDEAFKRYRERVESPTRCAQCPGLAICAADCPADPRGWVEHP